MFPAQHSFLCVKNWLLLRYMQARRLLAKDGDGMKCARGYSSGLGNDFQSYSAFLLYAALPFRTPVFAATALAIKCLQSSTERSTAARTD